MKNKWLIAMAFLLSSFALPAFANDFNARVDHSHVAAGESFTLQLSLTNTEAKGTPDTSSLRGLFTIASQGQSSNVVVINNHVTDTTSWEFTLIPKKEGEVTIPPISIETSKGVLQTDPIILNISQVPTVQPSGKNKAITVTVHADTLTPYKNQPILYTVKIIARGDIADLSLGDISVDNAVIEKQGDPAIADATENGEPIKIIKMRYLLTPLASGKITIPPMTLTGKMLDTQTALPTDSFDHDFGDPFAMIRNMDKQFSGFGTLKAFSVASNEVTLDVKPEAVAMDPWLPLTSLTIKEDLGNTLTARVGEPLTRKLILTAEGTGGKQLPDLENQQSQVDFNVYADKPATSETLKGNTIIGDRIESYSLIPKKAGKLELPAIKVPWWNLKTQQVEYATLPARTFDVMPAASTLVTSAAVQSQPVTQTQAPLPAPVTQPTAKPATSNESTYGVIGLLLLALMLAAVWVIRLQAKIKRLRQPDDNGKTAHTPVLTSSKSSFATKDLSSIQSVEELARFLRLYASEHYGIRENASLDEALLALAPLAGQRRELADGIIKIMSAALYAGKQADLETLKHACRELLVAHKQPKNDNTTPTEKLPKLNPG